MEGTEFPKPAPPVSGQQAPQASAPSRVEQAPQQSSDSQEGVKSGDLFYTQIGDGLRKYPEQKPVETVDEPASK